MAHIRVGRGGNYDVDVDDDVVADDMLLLLNLLLARHNSYTNSGNCEPAYI